MLVVASAIQFVEANHAALTTERSCYDRSSNVKFTLANNGQQLVANFAEGDELGTRNDFTLLVTVLILISAMILKLFKRGK